MNAIFIGIQPNISGPPLEAYNVIAPKHFLDSSTLTFPEGTGLERANQLVAERLQQQPLSGEVFLD